MSQDYVHFCPCCKIPREELQTFVRERVGCPANCSGKMVKKTIGHKCKKCGNVVRV